MRSSRWPMSRFIAARTGGLAAIGWRPPTSPSRFRLVSSGRWIWWRRGCSPADCAEPSHDPEQRGHDPEQRERHRCQDDQKQALHQGQYLVDRRPRYLPEFTIDVVVVDRLSASLGRGTSL